MNWRERLSAWLVGPRPKYRGRYTLVIDGPYCEVPLTQGKVAFVSPEDYERVMMLKWHALNCSKRDDRLVQKWYGAHTTYTTGRARGKLYLHRFIMEPPADMVVDHIDGNGLNNTRGNLRVVTAEENTQHTRFRGSYCAVEPEA